jgi:SnoaL-like domain
MDGTIDSTAEERLATLEAKEEIRTLKSYYCHWADRGYPGAGEDPVRFSELFTEDAVWKGLSATAKGRAEIAAAAANFRPFCFHFVTNPIIAPDMAAGTASGRWSILSAQTTDEGTALWIAGSYDDQFVRTENGWRFKSLTFQPAFRTPYSDGWARTPFI